MPDQTETSAGGSPTAQVYYHGSYVAGRRFVRAVLHNHAYVVVQTKRNPRGEIRGRIRPS